MSDHSAARHSPVSLYAEMAELEHFGTPFVLVLLCETIGSVPQDAGAKMLVTADGRRRGTVGGGRVEARAVEFALDYFLKKTAAPPLPCMVNWTLKGDVGMTCGGSVKLYFEPHHIATWSIAIFGAGHVAQALVPVLLPLPCRIACYDTRAPWLERFPRAQNFSAKLASNLAAEVDPLDDDTFVLCMTQGHASDFPILRQALTHKNFPFLGVIGSEAKAAVLRRELLASGLTADLAAKFTCPIGLPFGTNHPHEIALSIAAQLVSERDRVTTLANPGRTRPSVASEATA